MDARLFVISGIVLETGGMLAHASCLAREYGRPAVQLRGALSRIPDGADVTVDGAAGSVTLHVDGEKPGTDTGAGTDPVDTRTRWKARKSARTRII